MSNKGCGEARNRAPSAVTEGELRNERCRLHGHSGCLLSPERPGDNGRLQSVQSILLRGRREAIPDEDVDQRDVYIVPQAGTLPCQPCYCSYESTRGQPPARRTAFIPEIENVGAKALKRVRAAREAKVAAAGRCPLLLCRIGGLLLRGAKETPDAGFAHEGRQPLP
jgi:hypothetical protein